MKMKLLRRNRKIKESTTASSSSDDLTAVVGPRPPPLHIASPTASKRTTGFRRRSNNNSLSATVSTSLLPFRRVESSWSVASTVSNSEDFVEDDACYSENGATLITPDAASTRDPNTASRFADPVEQHQQQLVMYEPTNPDSLTDAFGVWAQSLGSLVQSSEMATFLTTSSRVVSCAGDLALQTALLPVTLPMHVMCTTVDFMANVVSSTTGALMHHATVRLHSSAERTITITDAVAANPRSDDNGTKAKPSVADQNQEHNLGEGLVHGIFGLSDLVFGLADHVTKEVGSIMVHMVAPVLGASTGEGAAGRESDLVTIAPLTKAVSSTNGKVVSHLSDDDNFLERLRLDFSDVPSHSSEQVTDPSNTAVVAKGHSRFLLRVEDIGFEQKIGTVAYIDLQEKDHQLITAALERLVMAGLTLIANHPTVRMSHPYDTNTLSDIAWKMEGSTSKLLRKMVQLSTLERLQVLQKETLVWSGKYKIDADGTNRKAPFYLARGVVPKSPRDFLHLLWDNSRTGEYNTFCLGRKTLLTIADDILLKSPANGPVYGIKVVQSETRVPFTSLSVHVNCLMHVSELAAPDDGYVIVSRSLDSGPSGTHVEEPTSNVASKVSRPKNEILWGINVLRAVPNHPDRVDLTSVSQVGSSLVPKFLAGKIAMMGLQEFFDNVRNPKTI
jgi:hypothetical protein